MKATCSSSTLTLQCRTQRRSIVIASLLWCDAHTANHCITFTRRQSIGEELAPASAEAKEPPQAHELPERNSSLPGNGAAGLTSAEREEFHRAPIPVVCLLLFFWLLHELTLLHHVFPGRKCSKWGEKRRESEREREGESERARERESEREMDFDTCLVLRRCMRRFGLKSD